MSFWDFFRNNRHRELEEAFTSENNALPFETKFNLIDDVEANQPIAAEKKLVPDIPEELFIEKAPPAIEHLHNKFEQSNPITKPIMIPQPHTESLVEDINLLYNYLNTDYEKQGYEDAMINPDTKNMDENLDNIKSKLFIVIAKVKNYYKRHLRTIEFHIDSRGRSGMIDTVDELMSHKETAIDELKTVVEIEQDTIDDKGLSQNLFNSYRKGFRNGLAAISFDTILKRK